MWIQLSMWWGSSLNALYPHTFPYTLPTVESYQYKKCVHRRRRGDVEEAKMVRLWVLFSTASNSFIHLFHASSSPPLGMAHPAAAQGPCPLQSRLPALMTRMGPVAPSRPPVPELPG